MLIAIDASAGWDELVETFADNARADLIGYGAQGAQQLLARRVLIDSGDECAIDLDELWGKLYHGFETRVTRTDVVHRDLEPELSVVVANLPEDLEARDRLLFRYLQHDIGRCQPATLERSAQRVGSKAWVVDRRRANVEEELRIAGKIPGSVQTAPPAETVELKQ